MMRYALIALLGLGLAAGDGEGYEGIEGTGGTAGLSGSGGQGGAVDPWRAPAPGPGAWTIDSVTAQKCPYSIQIGGVRLDVTTVACSRKAGQHSGPCATVEDGYAPTPTTDFIDPCFLRLLDADGLFAEWYYCDGTDYHDVGDGTCTY